MDEFGQFFSQMPPGLIANICTIGILLVGLIVYFGAVKPRRVYLKRQAELRSLESAAPSPTMPDMDMLTDVPPVEAEEPTLILAGSRAKPTEQPVPSISMPARRQGEYGVKLSSGRSTRAVEVIAILRDSGDDRLIVQLDGTGYRTLVDHPDVKAKFAAIMSELAKIVNEPDTAPVPTTEHMPIVQIEEPELIEEPEPEPIKEPEPEVEAPAEMELDFPDLDILSSTPAPRVPPPLPTADLIKPPEKPQVKSGGFLRPGKAEAEPVPELNLAGSIEAYLQGKLRQSPDFNGRNIHVHPAVHGGVVIQVDQEYFDSVGEVTDLDVRTFISEAIQEWQEHQ